MAAGLVSLAFAIAGPYGLSVQVLYSMAQELDCVQSSVGAVVRGSSSTVIPGPPPLPHPESVKSTQGSYGEERQVPAKSPDPG